MSPRSLRHSADVLNSTIPQIQLLFRCSPKMVHHLPRCQRRNLGCYSPCHNSSFPTCNQPPPSAGSTSYFYFYLFIWLWWVLVAACRIFSCGMQTLGCSMWDLVPWPGFETGPPATGVCNLSHWATREVPHVLLLNTTTTIYLLLLSTLTITSNARHHLSPSEYCHQLQPRPSCYTVFFAHSWKKPYNLSSKSNFTIERGHYSYRQQDNKQTLDLFWKSRTGNHAIRLLFLKHIPHHVTCLLKRYSWLPHYLLNDEQTSQKACHGLTPSGSPAPRLTLLSSHASATGCIPPNLYTLPWS